MLKEFSYKQFGKIKFVSGEFNETSLLTIAEHIKVLFLPKMSKVQVDFQEFKLSTDALLFINPGVVIKPEESVLSTEVLLHFN